MYYVITKIYMCHIFFLLLLFLTRHINVQKLMW